MQQDMWKDLPEHGRCLELKKGCPAIQVPSKVQGIESLSWLSKPSGNDIRVRTPLLCVGVVCIGRTGCISTQLLQLLKHWDSSMLLGK